MADPQLPEQWRKYVRGLCNDCWAGCCTLPVEARAADLERLGWITKEEAESEWAYEDISHRLHKRRLLQGYDPKSQLFTIAQVAGRDCILLDPKTRLCTVYDKRPDVCRGFPHIGPKPGYCPYKKK